MTLGFPILNFAWRLDSVSTSPNFPDLLVSYFSLGSSYEFSALFMKKLTDLCRMVPFIKYAHDWKLLVGPLFPKDLLHVSQVTGTRSAACGKLF